MQTRFNTSYCDKGITRNQNCTRFQLETKIRCKYPEQHKTFKSYNNVKQGRIYFINKKTKFSLAVTATESLYLKSSLTKFISNMHQKACVSQQHELLTTTSRPKKKICRELHERDARRASWNTEGRHSKLSI